MALSHRLAPLALLLTLVGCSDPSPASVDASASDASDASDVSASVDLPMCQLWVSTPRSSTAAPAR